MTSYNPNHLLKAPLPGTITLEGSTVSLYESVGWGGKPQSVKPKRMFHGPLLEP